MGRISRRVAGAEGPSLDLGVAAVAEPGTDQARRGHFIRGHKEGLQEKGENKESNYLPWESPAKHRLIISR
jgi:hypothetical protein